MAQVISLFNHKGGVSKTTTSFNLGWMLAAKGRRVMLVDCDPQCNLTGMVLGLGDLETEVSIRGTRNGVPLNFKEGLSPAFESRPTPMRAVECIEVPGNANLFLLPGNIGLSEYEVTLGIAQELSGSLVTLRNLPGSLRHLIDLTAQQYQIDFVVVDMSPSLGSVNQNLLSTSDFFLIPMHPDYFSTMAIHSLSSTLPKWHKWAKAAEQTPILKQAEYPLPPCDPGFLGYVLQKYRPRNGQPSRAFQDWVDQLEEGVRETLIPALESCGMMLPSKIYELAGFTPSQPILQMPDFNSLIAKSQEHRVPVFELTKQQLNVRGKVYATTEASQENFRGLFDAAAQRVLTIADAVRN